jgi:hypothetical protein
MLMKQPHFVITHEKTLDFDRILSFLTFQIYVSLFVWKNNLYMFYLYDKISNVKTYHVSN